MKTWRHLLSGAWAVRPRTATNRMAILYDAANDKPIWSASSEKEIRGSDQKQIISSIGVMVNAMADQRLLRQESWMIAQGSGRERHRGPRGRSEQAMRTKG